MTTCTRLYRGFEIHLLIYPHRPSQSGTSRNYDEGFDASVRIFQPKTQSEERKSQVFRVPGNSPFKTTGDARRASTTFAEGLIDSNAIAAA